ncbi:MAG: arsenate reductase (glutaredoxin) [Alphaproteobacteria bacterium]|nr:arsenate reductase (glutaredoxin) [Alphaproteobacteria bacterium]
MSVTIYHNPRCSKSRQTLALLEENGVTPDVVLYLEAPPNAATIKDIVGKLGLSTARDLMRKGEAAYKEQNLKEVTDEAALIQAMADTPILIERPIVIKGPKARIGRPPESVLEIL